MCNLSQYPLMSSSPNTFYGYCPSGMSGILDDVKDVFRDIERDFRHKEVLKTEAEKLVKKGLAEVGEKILGDKDVQQVIKESAEERAIEEGVKQVRDLKKELQRQIAQATKSPGAYMAANPMMTTAIVGGGVFMLWMLFGRRK